MRLFKIVLSVLFVLSVSFLVVRGCVPKKTAPSLELGGPPAVKKKIVMGAARKKQPFLPAVTVKEKPLQPRMAIILDDWGNNYSLVKAAVEVQRPLTLSILPNLKFSRQIAEEASARGLGVMLHMPMQPKNSREALEPQTILTTTSDDDIRRFLNEALQSIPHVEGANNHMGSAATCDARVMKVFLKELKQRGLFFVDSFVIARTVGLKVAREEGVRSIKRDVFIDNEMNRTAIRNQLLRAKRIALLRGKVVVIGHDRMITLRVLRETVPEIEKDGVEFVLVRDLLEKQ